MGQIGSLTSFTASTTAKAAEVNANFSEIKTKANSYAMWIDTICAVTVSHTYSASQTFTGGWTAAAACSISTGGFTVTAGGITVVAGGITVTGNSTITGTLGGVTTATITTMAGNVNFTGTPTFAAGLTVTAGTTTVGTLTLGTAGKILSGATSIAIRDNADGYDVLKFTNGTTALEIGTASVGSIGILSGGGIQITPGSGAGTGNLILGHVGPLTSTTEGLPIIPVMAGVPSGSLADGALAVDSNNNRLYVRVNSAWKYASLT